MSRFLINTYPHLRSLSSSNYLIFLVDSPINNGTLQSRNSASFTGYTSKLASQFNYLRNHVQIRRLSSLRSRNKGGRLEHLANIATKDPARQHTFLKSVVTDDPYFVIRRVESGKFAINQHVISVYEEAINLTSPKTTNESANSTKASKRAIFMFIVRIMEVGLFILVAYVLFNSRMGMLMPKDYTATIPKVTFEDVAGNTVAKKEMEDLVKILTEPEKFTEMGCKMPKGYLLAGPPGVGKTLLARALAGEAAVPFFFASGSEFDEMFAGLGAKRVRDLFSSAKRAAPSIIFIDEIDSIGISRQASSVSADTLNQLLAEMDGFQSHEGVIVLAATNDPDVLDAALIREGRFDGKISLTKPSVKTRLEILKVHTRNKTLHEDAELEELARACTDMSGAQLATMANIAGIRAVQKGKDAIDQDDLEFARAKVLMGAINKGNALCDAESAVIAAHEAGHAILSMLRQDITKTDLYIATIESRGFTLGHVHSVPKNDFHSIQNDQLIALIDVAFGGRAAEEIYHNEDKDKVTTGCSMDMANATRCAEMLIENNGYSKKIGYVRYSDSGVRNAESSRIIQEEVKVLLDERYNIVKSELRQHKKEWERLSSHLLEYRTLTGAECKVLFDGGKLTRSPFEGLPSS